MREEKYDDCEYLEVAQHLSHEMIFVTIIPFLEIRFRTKSNYCSSHQIGLVCYYCHNVIIIPVLQHYWD